MQNGWALQSGTSHFLGQNFAKAQNIKFAGTSGAEEFCWTTSWGVSTRLIGAAIMTHSDDDGLVLPPPIAPHQVVLLPIHRTDEEKALVMEACRKLQADLAACRFGDEPIRVKIDARDMRGGDKVWQHVKQGVPIRVEIGPRDLAAGAVSVTRRDRGPKDRESVPLAEFPAKAAALLRVRSGLRRPSGTGAGAADGDEGSAHLGNTHDAGIGLIINRQEISVIIAVIISEVPLGLLARSGSTDEIPVRKQ
jgi:prolyl-tRNA synthetase